MHTCKVTAGQYFNTGPSEKDSIQSQDCMLPVVQWTESKGSSIFFTFYALDKICLYHLE